MDLLLTTETVEIPAIKRAAGIIVTSTDGHVLLMRRTDSQGWAFPGGGIEDGETPEQAARRELTEETGVTYDGELKIWTRRIRDGVDFTTHLGRSNTMFAPIMNDEHNGYTWVTLEVALSGELPLHQGCYIALRRFGMDELGVARAIRDGELTSPQMYGENLCLVSMRVTGTGGSYRPAADQFVLRAAEIYMNQDFVDRCAGLPVIFRHPKKSMLNTDEFRGRTVGAIFFAYMRPEVEEIWCIARINDMDAAELLTDYRMSTSPGVLCHGQKFETTDGKKILLENKPHFLDHLAILIPDLETGDAGAGVWDKGMGLTGVESVDAKDIETDEPSVLDSILGAIMSQKIGDLSSRFDSQ